MIFLIIIIQGEFINHGGAYAAAVSVALVVKGKTFLMFENDSTPGFFTNFNAVAAIPIFITISGTNVATLGEAK